MPRWSLHEAKARFSALVDAALAGAPQEVTRRGRPAVVVVSAEQYARLLSGGPERGFAEHLLALPRDGGDGDPFAREDDAAPRDVAL